MTPNKIEMAQTDFHDAFLTWHPFARFVAVVFLAALIAYYVPFLIAALFGRMLNQIWMWIDLGVSLVPLILLSLIGNRLNRVWLVSGILAGIYVAYEISLAVRVVPITGNWWDFVWRGSLPFISILLNAALFLWGRRYAELDDTADV